MSVRTRRVAGEIQKELADLIRKEVHDPRITKFPMITVSNVDLANDHRNANIYLAFMGAAKGQPEVKAALTAINQASLFLHKRLKKRLSLKTIPQLNFRFDSSFDYATQIKPLLDTLQTDENETVPELSQESELLSED